MFGIGVMELSLILIVALVVFGPKRLPEIGKGVGQAIREFRKAGQEFTSTLTEEASRPTPLENKSSEDSSKPADNNNSPKA
jgi:sec-independent protein translocase protein TatA